MDHESAGDEQGLEGASEAEKADVELGKKLASNRNHPAVKAAGKVGKIGDQGPLYAISAGLLLIGLSARNRRLSGSGVVMLASIALADLGKSATKRLVSRTRPQVLFDERRYESEAGGSNEKPKQSFPSGHMAGSVAVARALSRNFPKAGAGAGLAAVAIGLSRLAKGAHWPLDVAGGAIIGLAAEAAATNVIAYVFRSVQHLIPERYRPIIANHGRDPDTIRARCRRDRESAR